MRKKQLEKLLNHPKIQIDQTLMRLLADFLRSDAIQRLGKNDDVTFAAYLEFIQRHHPDTLALFKSDQLPQRKIHIPWVREIFHWHPLPRKTREFKLISQFLNSEKKKNSLVRPVYLTDGFDTSIIHHRLCPSAIICLPDGNILMSNRFNNYPPHNNVSLYDRNFNFIRILIPGWAAGLARFTNGDIITSTYRIILIRNAQNDLERVAVGDITTYAADGTFRRTLSLDPANALAVTSDGNILSSFIYDPKNSRPRVVLRSPNGVVLRTISYCHVTSMLVLPDAHILTAGKHSIALRDHNFNLIKKVSNEKTRALALTPEGNVLSCKRITNHFFKSNDYVICLNRPKMIEHKGPLPFLESVRVELMAAVTPACLEFQKIYCDQSNLVARLPIEILERIYTYVFAMPEAKSPILVDPYCLTPAGALNNMQTVRLASLFAKAVTSQNAANSGSNRQLTRHF